VWFFRVRRRSGCNFMEGPSPNIPSLWLRARTLTTSTVKKTPRAPDGRIPSCYSQHHPKKGLHRSISQRQSHRHRHSSSFVVFTVSRRQIGKQAQQPPISYFTLFLSRTPPPKHTVHTTSTTLCLASVSSKVDRLLVLSSSSDLPSF
jgi:hypothetical protein